MEVFPQHNTRANRNVSLAPKISSWGGLLAIYMLCTFVISTANAEIFSIPRLLIVSAIFIAWSLYKLRLKVSKNATVFAGVYLLALLPGSIASIYRGEFDWSSAANLAFSLLLFVSAYSFVYRWISTNREKDLIRWIDWLIIWVSILAIVEILFYEQVYIIRDRVFNLSKFFDYHIGMLRELSVYGIPRPSAFFSEPSNFARFIFILMSGRMALSGYNLRATLLLVFFVILTRSAQVLFAAPALFLIYLWTPSITRKAVRQIRRVARLVRIPAAIMAGLLLLGGLVYLQGERGSKALEGTDSSLTGRIFGPVAYILDRWEHPWIGSGATPQNDVGKYSFLQGRTDRALLLEVNGYREANAPIFVLVVAWGVIGLILFVGLCFLLLGQEGIIQVGVFFVANLFSGGYNSPMMFLPLALMMAIVSYAWRKRQYSLARVGSNSGVVTSSEPSMARVPR